MKSLELLPLRAVACVPTPYSAIKMAGTRAYQSPCQNPLPVKHVIDEPAEQAPGASIDNSGFCALTLIPPPLLTPVESYLQSLKEFQPISVAFTLPAPILLVLIGSRPRFSSSSRRRTIQSASESSVLAHAEPRKQPLQAYIQDFCHGKSHIDRYHLLSAIQRAFRHRHNLWL